MFIPRLKLPPGWCGPEANPFVPLQVGYDFKQVAGCRISLGPKHLVHGLHMQPGVPGQFGKPDRRIDVVVQQLLLQRDFSR